MKILIADDSRLDRLILSEQLKQRGDTVVEAFNGKEAVDKFISEKPDLILMDVVMPELDGIEATAKIKSLSAERWIPIIMLTASLRIEDIKKGVEAGADDYLGKPFNWIVLSEKLKIFNRIKMMQDKILVTVGELEKYKGEKERENRFAERVMSNHLQQIDSKYEKIRHCVIPSGDLSGDVVTAMHSPTGNLYVLLADGMGHGLPAGLCVSFIVDIFHAMTKKGFPIGRIVEDMNQKLLHSIPYGYFVAAAVTCINYSEKTIEIWNGGLPAPLFITPDGSSIQAFSSLHPPLGVLKGEEFSSETEKYGWNEGGGLYLFSDGYFQVTDSDRVQFTEKDLEKTLIEIPAGERFNFLRSKALILKNQYSKQDDISLIEVLCDNHLDPLLFKKSLPSVNNKNFEHFSFRIHLEATVLKKISIIPCIYQMLFEASLEKEKIDQFIIILTELYLNALEHGLLKLDSKIKSNKDGFSKYQRLRQIRINDLKSGFIDIEITTERINGLFFMKLVMTNNGDEFSPDDFLNSPEDASSENKHGRGIRLVKALAERLAYFDHGKRVEVSYLI
jgi:CheY-like chemotaxis protein